MSQYTIFSNLPSNQHDIIYNIRPKLGYTPDKSSSRSDIYIKHDQQIRLINILSRPSYNVSIHNSVSHTFYLQPITKQTIISPLVHNNQYIYNSPLITNIKFSQFHNIKTNNIAIAPNYPIRRYINA